MSAVHQVHYFGSDLLGPIEDLVSKAATLGSSSPALNNSPPTAASPLTASSHGSWEGNTPELKAEQRTPSSGDMDLPSVSRTTPAGSETSPLFMPEEPEITDCPYCRRSFRQPRVLDCLHALCEDCIIAQLDPRPEDGTSPAPHELELELEMRLSPEQKPPPGVIRCPVCKQETRVGNDVSFVSRLLLHYVMFNMIDTKAIDKVNVPCESCKTKEKAMARCVDCNNYLCPNCVQAHQFMRCFEGHRVLQFEEIKRAYDAGEGLYMHRPIHCEQHPGTHLRYYCVTCQLPVCDVCLVSSHQPPEHQAHRTTDTVFDTSLRSELKRLIDLSEKKKRACDNACNEREKLQEELNTKVEMSREMIENMFDEFREMLANRKEQLLQELDEKHSDGENQLNSTFNTIANTSNKIVDACSFAQGLLTNGNTMELLVSRKAVKQQLNQLYYSVPNPDMTVSFEYASSAEQFRQALYTCCGQFNCGIQAAEPRLDLEPDILKPDITAMQQQPPPLPFTSLAPNPPPPTTLGSGWNSQNLFRIAESLAGAAAVDPVRSPVTPFMPPQQTAFPVPPVDPMPGLTDNIHRMTMAMLSDVNDPPRPPPPHAFGAFEKRPDNQFQNPVAAPPAAAWSQGNRLSSSSYSTVSPSLEPPPGFPDNHRPMFGSGRSSVTPLENGPPISAIGNMFASNNTMPLGGFGQMPYSSAPGPVPIGSRPSVAQSHSPMFAPASNYDQNPIMAVGQNGLDDVTAGMAPGSVPPVRQEKMASMQIRSRFGSLGPNDAQFNSPHGFCLGFGEEVVVADTNNHRIQVFSKAGDFLSQFGLAGKEEGQLWYPRKVAINRADSQYIVCDRGNERSRMQIFDRSGLFVKKIAVRYIDIVAGLAVDTDGSIVAVDSVTPTVFRISQSGDLLRWFDCSEYMKEPSDIAVADKEYFICDFKGHSVCVFSDQGMFLRKIGSMEVTSFPNGIDISDAGDVLIGDSHGNKFHVAVFKRSGEFQTEFDCPYVKVSRCCGLRITSEGYIVTLAKNNHHVLVLNTLYVE